MDKYSRERLYDQKEEKRTRESSEDCGDDWMLQDGMLSYEESQALIRSHAHILCEWYYEEGSALEMVEKIRVRPDELLRRYARYNLDSPWGAHVSRWAFDFDEKNRNGEILEIENFDSDEEEEAPCYEVYSDTRSKARVEQDVASQVIRGFNPQTQVQEGVERQVTQRVSITVERIAVEQQTQVFPPELMKVVMSYVPSAFKVAKWLVPSRVASDKERERQWECSYYDPSTLEQRVYEGRKLNLINYVDIPFDSRAPGALVRPIVRYARSPTQLYRTVMGAAGAGVTRVSSYFGRTRLINDYRAQVERASIGLLEWERRHLRDHVAGMLPPRQTTTYSAGLLAILLNDDTPVLNRWEEPTLVTGPERGGYKGGCLLDSYGNLVGFVAKGGGTAKLCLWSQSQQAWYTGDPRTSVWQRQRLLGPCRPSSSASKMPGPCVRVDSQGCGTSRCSLKHPKVSIHHQRADFQMDEMDTYKFYHGRDTLCPCDMCLHFLVDKGQSATQFLRRSYMFEIHQEVVKRKDPVGKIIYEQARNNRLMKWAERSAWGGASCVFREGDPEFSNIG